MSQWTLKMRQLFGKRSPGGVGSSGVRKTLRLERLEDRCVPAGNATGSVAGVAFVDANHDGVHDAQEFALPGVNVTLTNLATGAGVPVTTDAGGAFRFDFVQPGTYRLSYGPQASFTSAGGGQTATTLPPFSVAGGQAVSEDVPLGGLTPDLINQRQFLSTTTAADWPLPSPGSGVAQVGTRANSAPFLATPIPTTTGRSNTSSLIDLAAYFRDPDTTDSVVRFDTSAGPVNVELFDAAAPQTVANFLDYARAGAYDSSIFHRLVNNFVLQGGGFTLGQNPTSLTPIATFPPVKGEFGASNTAGTLAMALSGSPANPDSGTDEFFFNLVNNAGSLDPQKFTVFGKVVGQADMAVLNTLAQSTIRDESGGNPNSPFGSIPLNNYTGSHFPGDANPGNFDLVNAVSVVSQNERLTYSLVANSNPNLVRTTIQDNRLTLNYAAGQAGTATITVRATDTFGASADASFNVFVRP